MLTTRWLVKSSLRVLYNWPQDVNWNPATICHRLFISVCLQEGLTDISGNMNAQADLRLLKEQHMILRTQFQAGHISQNKRNSLLVSLGKSVKNLGDYYAR